jgi:putative transposase
LCGLIKVARSSYHYHLKNCGKVNPERESLQKKAVQIRKDNRGAAGARSIVALLNQTGENIGRHKAASLMAKAGIISKQPSITKYRESGNKSIIATNHLKRNFKPSAPNEIRCGDVTYIWAGDQWLYLAAIMDLYSKKIVDWACSDNPDSELTAKIVDVLYSSYLNNPLASKQLYLTCGQLSLVDLSLSLIFLSDNDFQQDYPD